ncbi:MAG: hypothetical protein JW892_01240 [Anaerolineae bacterium]|nr:hypothetical protein [Anaerolineae bacterium]
MTHIEQSGASTLTGSKQTMASWARVIESPEDIPPAYQDAYAAITQGKPEFPTLILTPASRELSRKISEKLLWTADKLLTVLERDGKQITVHQFALDTLRDVEVGTILLYSWITISGMTQTGEFAVSTLAFNTATLRHFTSLLEQAREFPAKAPSVAPHTEHAKLDYLQGSAYKFMNFGKSSLRPDAHVLGSLWQPEIRVKSFDLLGVKLYRTISTAHLLIITDKEITLIRDDARIKSVRGSRHGGVWRYIPKRSLVATEIGETTSDLLTMNLFLTNDGHLDILFAAEQRQALSEIQMLLP